MLKIYSKSKSKYGLFLNGFLWTKLCSARKFVRDLSKILEILRFESHSQSANGLERPFGVKNDKYGLCHGADFCKNDTLSRSRNPEMIPCSAARPPGVVAPKFSQGGPRTPKFSVHFARLRSELPLRCPSTPCPAIAPVSLIATVDIRQIKMKCDEM